MKTPTKNPKRINHKHVLRDIKKFMDKEANEDKDYRTKLIQRAQASAVKLPPSSDIDLEQLPEFVSTQAHFQGKGSRLQAKFVPDLTRLDSDCESKKTAVAPRRFDQKRFR